MRDEYISQDGGASSENRPEPLDSLTLLTTKGPLATKRIVAVPGGLPKIEDYGKAARFRFSEWPISSFDELVAHLTALHPLSGTFLVRGKPAEGINRNDAPRWLKPRAAGPATLLPQARRWLALDLDSVPCPAGVDPIRDVDAVVAYIVALLPKEFHGVSVFWTFTSGHGIKPGIRIRLWYWLDRALSDQDVQAWLAPLIATGLIDGSIYRANQPTYIAAPIFNGMADPLPQRCGVWHGQSDTVAVPIIELPKPGRRTASSGSGTSLGTGGGYAAYRAQIGDGDDLSSFYAPLRGAIGAFIGKAGVDADIAWLRQDLEAAIREAPRNPALHSDSYVENRVADLDSWIAWTLDQEREKTRCEPTYPAPIGSAKQVREGVLVPVMTKFYADTKAWLTRWGPPTRNDLTWLFPPIHGVASTTGTSKTTLFLLHVVLPAVQDGFPVKLSVPRHNLGNQLVNDLAALGVTAGVYRGREADDPDVPGKLMCWEPDRVKAIEDAGHSASTFACSYTFNGVTSRCEHFYGCGYQKNLRKLKEKPPQVFIVPHHLLLHKKPDFIPDGGILGIDEAFWGSSVKRSDLDLSLLLESKIVPKKRKKKQDLIENEMDAKRTDELLEISYKTHLVLRNQPIGAVSRQAFIDAGITTDDTKEARRMENARRLHLKNVAPGTPLEQVLSACNIIKEHNKEVERLATFWGLLARTLDGYTDKSPWLFLWEDKEGKQKIGMSYHAFIHSSWHGPTMVMDACLPSEIVRQFLPFFPEPTVAMAAMPYVRVRQITDTVMAHSMFIPKEGARERDVTTCKNNVKKLSRFIEVRAAQLYPGRVLVVVQKGVKKALLELGDLPKNVEIAHYNAITGLNDWEDVVGMILVGRTEPPPREVERLARALFDDDLAEIEPDKRGRVLYPRVQRGIRMRDGSGVAVLNTQHPDWRAETVRQATAEAECVQAIGRPRGVNRTEENPVEIDILTNLALPGIEVDETTTWDAIQPSLGEVMAARGAVPLRYRDMATAYPDLFVSEEAARWGVSRGTSGETPIEEYLYIGISPEVAAVRYRRAGDRQSTRLLYDPRRIDPAVWLAAHLGEVTILSAGEPVAHQSHTHQE